MVIMGCQSRFALVHLLTAEVAGDRVDRGGGRVEIPRWIAPNLGSVKRSRLCQQMWMDICSAD